jgi:hypothetical protein
MSQKFKYQSNLKYKEIWTQPLHNLLFVSELLECHYKEVVMSVETDFFEFLRNERNSNS